MKVYFNLKRNFYALPILCVLGSMLFHSCSKDAPIKEDATLKKEVQTKSKKLRVSGVGTAPIDLGATQITKNLYKNLNEVAWNTKDILFGQEFYNSYSFGGGNHNDKTFSDFKDITGDHPAVLGQDFMYYIYKTSTERAIHKAAALHAYTNGAVVTFDFHMPSKYHAGPNYSSSDLNLMYNIGNNNDAYGEVTWFKAELDKTISIINELNIPITFRLLHEMNGNWFWWGTQANGGSASYQKMFQLAVNHIKSKTDLALFAWSPNYPFNSGTYPGTNYYPGDLYVDVVGLDMYDINTSAGQSFSVMVTELTAVSDFGWSHNKIPVFSEVGNRVNSPDSYPYWWYNLNEALQGSNRAFKLAWMLTWINQGWDGPAYAPYVAYWNSSTSAKTALRDFKNMSTTLMLSDSKTRNMYD